MLASPHDDDHKRSRLGRRTRSWFRLFKIRCRQIDFVRRIIDVHGLAAKSSRYGLHSLPFATLILDNTEPAFSRARECLMTIPARGVHAGGDGKIADHLAVVCAHYEHLLRFAASDEESVLLCING